MLTKNWGGGILKVRIHNIQTLTQNKNVKSLRKGKKTMCQK